MSIPLMSRHNRKIAAFHSMQGAFSRSIQNLRLARGETLEEFSRYTGISAAQLSRYENLVSPVPTEVAIRLGFIEFSPGENFTDKRFPAVQKKTSQEDQMTIFEQ
ncbi:helix-turn-helix domain-containing protein [Vibrio vulnificus]